MIRRSTRRTIHSRNYYEQQRQLGKQLRDTRITCKQCKQTIIIEQLFESHRDTRITCQAACHGKTEHGIFVKFKKPSKNCCRPTCRCHHLGYSVPPALHRTIWCRSTFGPRGPGLRNPTSFLRPALPMAPTRDDNARDKRSVLRPKPATFLRDFALYMTMKYAIIRKRCLNHAPCLNKKSKFLYGPVSPNFCARRSVMMILNLSESLAKPLVMAKLNMAYLSSLKNRAKLLSSYLPVSPSRVLRAPGTSPYHLVPKHLRATWPRPEKFLKILKIEIFVWSRISKFLRPAQRYDDFKLIRITCQAACHGKTEHGIFVKFKKPSKTAVVLLAGVTISGTPCPRHFTVPFGAEAPSGHVAQA